jgi:hypothetical protein
MPWAGAPNIVPADLRQGAVKSETATRFLLMMRNGIPNPPTSCSLRFSCPSRLPRAEPTCAQHKRYTPKAEPLPTQEVFDTRDALNHRPVTACRLEVGIDQASVLPLPSCQAPVRNPQGVVQSRSRTNKGEVAESKNNSTPRQ